MTRLDHYAPRFIVGHSLSGVSFVGEVDVDREDGDLDSNADDFVVVRWPLRIIETADPRDSRKVHVNLQPLYLSVPTPEWKVRLASYRLIEETGPAAALVNGYREMNKNETARAAGLYGPGALTGKV